MLKITAAATYAGCSRRFIERRLLDSDYRRSFKLSDGMIDAEALRDEVRFLANFPQPGRRIGTRFLFRLKSSKRSKPQVERDAWRISRALILIGKIKDREGLQMIADVLARQGINPAGSPKT